MAYLLLIAAIGLEVVATLSLRASDGLSRPLLAAVVVIGYVGAFTALALCLKRGLPLGIAYGIWAASGVALVAVLSWALFGERLSPLQMGGIGCVVVGVLALELGASH